MCIRDSLGGICDTVREAGGIVMITSTHGNCEEMIHAESGAVSYTHLRAHETVLDLVCRLLLEKKKKKQ